VVKSWLYGSACLLETNQCRKCVARPPLPPCLVVGFCPWPYYGIHVVLSTCS
jgi:hypothetical protein